MLRTLRRKILGGYGLVLLLLILVFAWAFANLLRLGRASDAILSENYRSILAAENMINASERQDSAVLLYVLGLHDVGIRQFRQNQVEFLEWLGRAKDNITIEGEERVLAAIDSSYTAYLIAFTRLLEQERAPAPGDSLYQNVLLPTFLPVRRACASLRELNEQTMFAAGGRARGIAQTAMVSMGVIGLGALLLGLLFSLILSRRLVLPIRQMRAAAQRIAQGDYDVEVPPGPSDELGQLARQFNEMTAQLRAFHELNVEQIVAEQRKSEAIIQSIDDGLVVIDADLNVRDLNPAAARVLEVDPDGARGRHFLEVIRSERLFEYVKATVESGQAPVFEEDQNFLTVERGGQRQHYQFAVTPVYTPTKAVLLGVILLLRDVTKLKELDRLKSEFVATASHQLRTPLTSIGMSIGLLRERAAGKLDARTQELVDVAQEDVERLRELVDDLLDLSRIEAGRLELDYVDVPVRMLFEKAVSSFNAQAEEEGVGLDYDLPEELPEVRVDAEKMTWVLTNLISNALRHTERGGHVHLSAEGKKEQVQISVEDDGEGIPYAYQSKIFDKFVQVDSDKSSGGSGLGLTICKEIVRAHGGHIWVDSTPGEGSTFTFTLPAVE